MVRIIAIIVCLFSFPTFSEEIVNGLITASQVDVTADDGSLLPDRMNVGDVVYIVVKPSGGKKDGWVRVSRSPDDKIGFGWVEQKYIRTFSNYKDLGGGSKSASSETSDPFSAPTPSSGSASGLPDELSGLPFVAEEIPSSAGSSSSGAFEVLGGPSATKHQKIGLIRFTAQTNDAFVSKVFEEFNAAMSSLEGLKTTVINQAAKAESEAVLQKLADKNKVDGILVGSVSDALEDGRLVQVRFYSSKDRKFTVEKVTRVPLSGPSKTLITNFAQSVVDQIKNPI